MSKLTKEQRLHRRAQAAEGAVQSASYIIGVWEKTLNARMDPMWGLTRHILMQIKRQLERATKEGK